LFDWHTSSHEVSGYGQRGKTKVNGHYISAKVGINFNENYNLELEHAKHKIHADSFTNWARLKNQCDLGNAESWLVYVISTPTRKRLICLTGIHLPGINFNENYNLELEHAKHKIHADSFRSFDINGLDAKFNRTSVNLIVNF
jgi:hypothetical protein